MRNSSGSIRLGSLAVGAGVRFLVEEAERALSAQREFERDRSNKGMWILYLSVLLSGATGILTEWNLFAVQWSSFLGLTSVFMAFMVFGCIATHFRPRLASIGT